MASKSLGTLTLDLIARTGGFVAGMDKAERASAKWRKQVEQQAAAAGAAVGAATAVAAGAMAVWVRSSIDQAAELQNLAQVAGTSTTEFQKFAAGARTVGIENDKLADILKDVNDRVGDFLTTGGGPMKDFFEQVAPKVGVTAEQFKNLSGPQALGLYVDTLQKAGANQQEMTFFMEAMASDATALIPLLKNGGQAMNDMAAEAEGLGLILSEDTIKQAKQFNEDLDLLGRVAGSVGQSVAAQLLPHLAELTGELRDPETAQAAAAMAKGVIDAFAGIIAAARETVGFIKWASESAAAYLYGAAPDDLVRRENEIVAELEGANNKLKELASELERPRLARINPFQSTPELESEYSAMLRRIKELEKARESLNATPLPSPPPVPAPVDLPGPAAGTGNGSALPLGPGLGIDLAAAEKSKTLEKERDKQRREAEKAATEALREQERIQQNYRDLVASLRTEDEQRLDTMREQLAVLDAMKGIPDAERAGVAGRIAGAATAEAPEFSGLAPEVGGPLGELNKIDEAEEKLAEWYASQLEQLDTFRQERADLTATWDAEELALKQEHETALAAIEEARRLANLAAGEEFFGNMAGAAKAFFGENSKLYKAAFAVEKAYAIGKALMNVPKSYSDAFAAVVGIPIVGPALAPAAGVAAAAAQVAQAAAIGNINMAGMAHDGIDSVPETGTWLLEKGERVTTAETSAKLDKTLSDIQQGAAGGAPVVNIIGDKSRAGSVDSRQQDSKWVIDVFVADVLGDGRSQKALSSKFGLQGVGR